MLSNVLFGRSHSITRNVRGSVRLKRNFNFSNAIQGKRLKILLRLLILLKTNACIGIRYMKRKKYYALCGCLRQTAGFCCIQL